MAERDVTAGANNARHTRINFLYEMDVMHFFTLSDDHRHNNSPYRSFGLEKNAPRNFCGWDRTDGGSRATPPRRYIAAVRNYRNAGARGGEGGRRDVISFGSLSAKSYR